jgi:uncharacterized protein (UPF0212 family)
VDRTVVAMRRVAPMTADENRRVDDAIQLAIERYGQQIRSDILDALDERLGRIEQCYRTGATCDAKHETEAVRLQAMEDRILSVERTVFWAMTTSAGALLSVIVAIVIAVVTKRL